jgi:CRISPR/Cas system CSM-associated protein Csm3 (group 7 of RAMP superfamily)
MNKERILIKGKIRNLTPLLIGSGIGDNSDVDTIRDKDGNPYIPATSFLGALKSAINLEENYTSDLLCFWGNISKNNSCQSNISCSDLELIEEQNVEVAIRDGIKLDNTTGMVKDKGKYDFEIIPSGTEFKVEIEITSNKNNYLFHRKMAGTILSTLEKGVSLGAKVSSGLGRIKLVEKKSFIYEFNNKKDILAWLKKEDLSEDVSAQLLNNKISVEENTFSILMEMEIKNSLIVRSYSEDPEAPDSVHIKDAGKNVLPGTSIKGALRARAEKIINTVLEETESKNFIESLFGNVEEDEEGNEKPGGYTIPSSFIVEEVPIEDVVDNESQYRIKIDRFTGGTIEGALMDNAPLFTKENVSNIKNLKISLIRNPLDSQKGLLLLLMKDLWTSDLPIGGEKNIGRGVFKGEKVVIMDAEKKIEISSPENIKNDDIERLKKLVKSFAKNTDKDRIEKRLALYKKNGRQDE